MFAVSGKLRAEVSQQEGAAQLSLGHREKWSGSQGASRCCEDNAQDAVSMHLSA